MGRWKAFAVALIAAARLVPAQPQESATPADVLEVVDLTFDPQTSRVTFGVVNKALKPVLAYGLKVTSIFADGTTKSGHFDEDSASTLHQVGRIIGPPGYHVGELRTGERCNEWRIQAPGRSRERPVSVTVVPDLVIFADNSVLGENEKAANRIFQERKEYRDAFAEQLELLRRFQASPNIEADLRNRLDNLKRAASVTPRRYFAYKSLDLQLQTVLQKCIVAKRETARQCLSKLIQSVEYQYSLIAAHAERAGGVE